MNDSLKTGIKLAIRLGIVVLTALLFRDVVLSVLGTFKIYGVSPGYRQLITFFGVCLADQMDKAVCPPFSVITCIFNRLKVN